MTSSPAPDAAKADRAAAVNGTLLYHQTLIPTLNVTHAIEGSFTLPDANDLVLVRHNVLELWRLYAEEVNGGMECISRTPLLSTVCAAVAVPTSASSMAKLHSSDASSAGGGHRSINSSGLDDASITAHRSGVHYLALTSETGYVTLLRYELAEPPVPTRLFYGEEEEGTNDEHGGGVGGTTLLVATSLRGSFVKVSEACLGRSGARLTAPVARMVVDPAGTALFLTALMRSKVLIPLVKNDSWDAARGVNAARDRENNVYEDESSGSDAEDEGSEDEDTDNAEGERRGPQSARERRAARRRRAANARRANGAIQFGVPIEVQRQTVLYSVCALDGYLDQAVFAVLEEEVVEAQEGNPLALTAAAAGAGGGTFLKQAPAAHGGAADGGMSPAVHHKHFVLYAYVPSLKQVQRTQLVHIPPTAHRLIAVPAAPYGPGGVLVSTDTELIWYDVSASQQQQQQSGPITGRAGVFKCSYPFPRRMDCSELLYDPSIIQHTLTCFGHRFFLLLQDEQGDVYRVFLETGNVQRAYDALRTRELLQASPDMLLANGGVLPPVPNPLAVHYFETLPPSSAMALFRRGFLFVGSESGALHELYKIRSNGYTSDREYVVKRVRRERVLPVAAAAAAPPVPKMESAKEERETDTSTGERKSCDDRKRPRDEAAAMADGSAVKSEPEDPTAVASPPSPSGMQPPLPKVKQEPPTESENTKSSTNRSNASMLPPTAAPASFKIPMETRVIKVFQPHRRPQHVVQLQSLPNSPAITSFIPHLTSSSASSAAGNDGLNTNTIAEGSGAALPASGEQPEIFFNYVGGRGAESTLVQARYGHAAKLEGRHVLPTVFASVIPLSSAASMQALARQQQAAIEAAAYTAAQNRTNSDGANGLRGSAARQQAQRLKALRQLAATVSGARDQVWTDRVLLCTRQGTTVYKIGRTVEQDTHAGFITAERTIAATTLQHGCGYAQVTPRGIHILSTAGSLLRQPQRAQRDDYSVVPTSWTHPHGNTVLSAAVTPSTILLSFHQRGGIASFDFGLTGTELQQRDVLPTFPLAPVVALLQPPASAVSAALQRELQSLLWNSSSAASASATASGVAAAAAAAAAAQTEQLAAIATVNHEVFLVHPRKLREPLEKIVCRRGAVKSDPTAGGTPSEVSITSLLLTYLGDAESGGNAVTALAAAGVRSTSHRGRNGSGSSARRQLFLFVGHSDGMVTRCELSPSSAKVTATVELWCGAHPCQLIAGDGETYCYVVSGDRTWRCEMQEGTVKMTPYSFPTRPNSFARFVLPSRSGSASVSAASDAASGNTAAALAAQEDEDVGNVDISSTVGTITLAPREQQQEVVIAVQNRELALYVSNTGAAGGGGGSAVGGGAGGVAYSFRHQPLPLAGRRLLQHPTRPAYLILCGVEHRSHGRQEVEQHRAEDLVFLNARTTGDAASSKSPEEALALYGGIPYTAPARSLGHSNTHNSVLQLYHQGAQRLLPPIYFEPREVITSVVVGSFLKEFGREPVVIVGTASMYTHGAGCGTGASWRQGFLRTFRCSTTGSGTSAESAAQAGPLRLELLHSTYLRPDSNMEAGSASRRPLNAEAVAEEARPDYASALCVCEEVGLLFVGMGSAQGLRIYSWGKEQLLRRRHLSHTPGQRINAIDYIFASPPGSRNGNAHMTSFDAMDLYQCPYGDDAARRLAREKQLFIVCGTVDASVFVAALQPGSSGGGHGNMTTPSFLLQIMTDRVPRFVTSLAVLDERTIAAADRFGTVVFLRIPENARTHLAQPISQLKEAELMAEELYLRTEQTFEEVARYHTGQLVTALRVQPYDPSQGADPSLAAKILYYSTALGSVGAFLPFMAEEDGALAAYLQPLMHAHLRPILSPPTMLPPSSFQSHHVVDGDLIQLLLRGGATSRSRPFTAAAKVEVEEALERQVKMEAARRQVLGLPKRTLPSLTELVAKQRALLTLPL
ncbi:hypothetical protein ABL78_7101 [Leptomonas seymouri]|uniref:Uncharacterized protein n=1 Tax=Leptomonas seymouri TaxID=5684 RepID=A0A0N1PCJ8_LEPSE|nr:hypothetical protein ABL78_7101 [Leptomonas seymouri]|eukprot:KPI83851.1 hypothetical protein ABL78_7101 [Leptomonas seymouri]